MQTIKTAVVVVLLLVVLYGVYEVLNRPEHQPPPAVTALENDIPGLTEPMVEWDSGDAMGGVDVGAASNGVDETASSLPNADQFNPGGQRPATQTPPPAPATNQPPYGQAVADSNAGQDPSPSSNPLEQQNPYYGDSRGFSPPAAAIPDENPTDPSVSQSPNQAANPGIAESGPLYPRTDAATDAGQVPATTGAQAYLRAKQTAQRDIEDGEYQAALLKLSIFYRSPDLTAEQNTELLNLLDPLAGKVIYSREHTLEAPYRVRRSETLMDVAADYDVPWQLLQKINGVQNPQVLTPGDELKVVRGPFRAQVSLSNAELTLFLGSMYAGRFPITTGRDPQPQPGQYAVRDKQTERAFFGDGRNVAPGSPYNPYGNVWIDLGAQHSIHGSPRAGNSQIVGCISLSPRDAEDVFSIIGVGSKVEITP